MKSEVNVPSSSVCKGLQRQRLIGSAVAGFNHARTITKASATGLDERQDDNNKGICSTGSLVNNPVKYDSLDASISMEGQVVFDFQMLQSCKYFRYSSTSK